MVGRISQGRVAPPHFHSKIQRGPYKKGTSNMVNWDKCNLKMQLCQRHLAASHLAACHIRMSCFGQVEMSSLEGRPNGLG